MKKRNALAGAAALAMLAGGAQAQSAVQLTGLLDVFGGSMRVAGDAGRTSVVNSGGMTTSWIGFKGTEDLGGGLKASFALTSFLRVDSGIPGRFNGDPYFSRDSNVSLSGGFGTVTVGRALAPNFLPTILFNPLGDSFTFSPLVLHNNISLFNGTGWTGTTPSDTGWSNEIIYSTPNWNGLSANVHYQFGEVVGTGGPHNFGFNVLYFAGSFAATAFYERDNISNPIPAAFAGGATREDWMVGASYDFTAAKLFATYGQAKNDVTPPKARTLSLGVSLPFGAGKLLAAAARTEVDPGNTRKTYTVGYDHNLSKRTDVYAMVMRDSITTFSSGTSIGLGVRTRF